MEYKADVLEKLKTMGDYFCKLVEDPEIKFTNKARAANLGLQCYSEILKSEGNKEVLSAVDFFMTGITEKILRTELYKQYLTFCLMKELTPEPRNIFYNKVRKLQFGEKRESDGRFFLPPP